MINQLPRIAFEPSASHESALKRAADLWGIEPVYTDTWGKEHPTSPETQRGILEALGIDAGSREGIDRALEERLWREWSSLLPAVAVVSEKDRPSEFAIHIPEAAAGGRLAVEIAWEGGDTAKTELDMRQLQPSARAELHGESFLRIQVPLPATLPLGYHKLRAAVTGRDELRGETTLIVCPERAYVPPGFDNGTRAAGIAISLYGLRSDRNWGCGDTTDLMNFTDWVADDAGAAFVGLNPLHALANRYPYNISPYLPVSMFYQNTIYIDVEELEDFRNSDRAQKWIRRPEVQAEIERLRGAEFVQYEQVHALKSHALKCAFLSFLAEYRKDTPRAREFKAYVEREGELLERFAEFCALDYWIHKRNPDVWIWPDWPREYHSPESDAVRAFARKHWRLVLFFKYAQWQLDRQLAAAQEHARKKRLPIGLYHDLALATDRYGADVWAYGPFYVAGCRVGAPPDEFSPKGQDWSFPPPHTERHREAAYHLFAESIRKNCRHGGALRFDHVMRFFRLYWIPEGKEPTEGAYVRDYYEDILRILALESARNKVILVGEDLGTVTPQMRATLDRFGILGYKVPYFEKHRNNRFKLPSEYAELALVSSSTHDLPTVAGYWQSRDVDCRNRAGLLGDGQACENMFAERGRDKQKMLEMLHKLRLLPDWFPHWEGHLPELTGELHNAFVGFLATTPSRLMVLNQEDLFKETEQQNLPATTTEYPNWQRKMKFTIEELRHSPARDYTGMFRSWLEKTGRVNG